MFTSLNLYVFCVMLVFTVLGIEHDKVCASHRKTDSMRKTRLSAS